MLGIDNYQEDNNAMMKLAEIKSMLKNMNYVFLDEVSMLDCWSLYNISKCMYKILDNDHELFSSMNIIFAGNFAQLPFPMGYGSLYSHTMSFVIHTTKSYKQQEALIDKALWHQFTTVVILRENM